MHQRKFESTHQKNATHIQKKENTDGDHDQYGIGSANVNCSWYRRGRDWLVRCPHILQVEGVEA